MSGVIGQAEALLSEARKRLLNEPLFLIAIDFAIWFADALTYPAAFWLSDGDLQRVVPTFFTNLFTGLITTTVAFVVLEFQQRRIVPFFFPEGGLQAGPGTLR